MSSAEACPMPKPSTLSLTFLVGSDREAFRRAAEAALATSAPSSIYRVIVPLWRSFFHPPLPMEGRATAWDSGRKKVSLVVSRACVQLSYAPACAGEVNAREKVSREFVVAAGDRR